MTDERTRLIALVMRLVDARYPSEADLDRDVDDFNRSVPHPRATNLVYHWMDEFDHEPSPAEIVDHAFGYRPIEL